MKIVLIGYGKMGRLIHTIAEQRGHQIGTTVDESAAGATPQMLAKKITEFDAAIDFSAASAVQRNVEACMAAGIPLVEGTTGWDDQRSAIGNIVGDANGAFVFGANFSVGVNLFYRIVDFASDLISKFPEYEAFIEEQHHSGKKDAPSGTALKLKDIIGQHIPKELSVAATRAGNIPGTHRVGFDGSADQILLEHAARSREGFAIGALMAAEWVVGKTGFFEFGDIIDQVLEK